MLNPVFDHGSLVLGADDCTYWHSIVTGTRVAAFRPLAMVSADNPLAHSSEPRAQEEGELDAGDLATVGQALAGAGYVAVPEELLEQRYDGPRASSGTGLLTQHIATGFLAASDTEAQTA
jgi:hypothetical protein